MNEINEMRELCRVLLAEKHGLLKNIFNENNFKLKLKQEDDANFDLEKRMEDRFQELTKRD